MALRSAQREVMLITDAELADVHYKLGRICWTMGGHMQTEPHQARAHFEAATAVESDVQVGAGAKHLLTLAVAVLQELLGCLWRVHCAASSPLHLLSAADHAAGKGRGGAAA